MISIEITNNVSISKDRTISQPVLSLSLKLKFIAVGILEMFTSCESTF